MDSSNTVTKDKYIQERKILKSYETIMELASELKHTKNKEGGRPSSNRDKISKMRKSLVKDVDGQTRNPRSRPKSEYLVEDSGTNHQSVSSHQIESKVPFHALI